MARFVQRKSAVSGTAAGAALVVVVIAAAVAVYFGLYAGGSVSTQTVTSTSIAISTTAVVRTPTVSAILAGAGSTFVFPVLSAMVSQYETLKPSIQINYQSIGSGGGIAALEGHTVDFAASDAPLGATDQAKAPNALTLPITIGAVTVAYNVPNIASNLHLTGKVVADIFAGNVTTWNDPEIQSLNTNITLPAKSILVVHRSDGSGTTFAFTGYLSLLSSSWQKAIGQGKTVAWPVGLGANGNLGVAGVVQGTQYTIGYVELAYALQNKMTVASIQNSAGNWVLPSLASSTAAAQSISNLPAGNGDWSAVNLLNKPGQDSYPITSFVYALVYKELNVNPGETNDKATALVQFLWWVVHDGQKISPTVAYVPLPQNVVALDETTLQSITLNGQSLPTA